MTTFDPSRYTKKLPEPVVEEPEVTPTPDAAAERYFTPPDELDDVIEVSGLVFDPKVFESVLSVPEGMNHKEYRKALGRYVSTLSDFERVQIKSRREEIEKAELEWKQLNHEVLRRLGFNEAEAGMLCDKRLDSPGMRTLIRNRKEDVAKGLRAEAILRRVQ